MKRLYLTITVIFAIGLLIFNGCSTENNQSDEKQENVYQPTAVDIQIENKILDFESRVDFARENPNLKSGGDDLTLDEAIWNIEALANYNYSDASMNFENYVSETTEIEVPLSNGNVLLSNASIAYDQAIIILSEHFSQISGAEKQLVLADITLKEISGDVAIFTVTSSIGKGIWNPFADFGENDYWYAWDLQGKCDGSGQGVGTDAAEEIEKKIDWRIALPMGHRYFTDISVLEFDLLGYDHVYLDDVQCNDCSIINPNDDILEDNMYDYIIFSSYSGYPNHHECLIPNEMNFYLNGMEHLIYDLAYQWFPYGLDGKIFASCEIEGKFLIYQYTSTYMHEGFIHYGVSVGSGNPPPKEL